MSQLIDENQVFKNAEIKNKPYTLLSIVGSQSSGKSTLLNELFNLNFSVMQSSRQQTTRGIVASSYHSDSRQVIVCDVEGSDGREHGDQQHHERCLMLFALSVSDVLLFNVFENAVGLYHGANMGLMRMVLEIYHEIFISKSEEVHKKTLLFVVRDYSDTTPVSELLEILTQDIIKIWSTLTAEDLSKYFELTIHACPHFKLQKDAFSASVATLKNNIMSIQNNNHVHPDALNEYMSRIWKLIISNQELNVPTQMELITKYRVEKHADQCLESIKKWMSEHSFEVKSGKIEDSFAMISEMDGKISEYVNVMVKHTERISSKITAPIFEKTHHEIHQSILDFVSAKKWIVSIIKNCDSSDYKAMCSSINSILKSWESAWIKMKSIPCKAVKDNIDLSVKQCCHEIQYDLLVHSYDMDWRTILNSDDILKSFEEKYEKALASFKTTLGN
eukprot:NODE_273_length_11040_cov_1.244036.p3 type:complete len:447 gc:universal NODE_273_length_11040_cov_1.244036:8331-6991(-)